MSFLCSSLPSCFCFYTSGASSLSLLFTVGATDPLPPLPSTPHQTTCPSLVPPLQPLHLTTSNISNYCVLSIVCLSSESYIVLPPSGPTPVTSLCRASFPNRLRGTGTPASCPLVSIVYTRALRRRLRVLLLPPDLLHHIPSVVYHRFATTLHQRFFYRLLYISPVPSH